MTDKRRRIIKAFLQGEIRQYEAIAQLKCTRDKFTGLCIEYAKEELSARPLEL